jgi:hypothetical protein
LPVDLKSLTKLPARQWTVLFTVYLILNFVVQGLSHPAFAYTMVYTLAFLLIAITLAKTAAKEKITPLFAIMSLFVGMLTWVVSGAYLPADAGMWLSIVFTLIAFASELGWLETRRSIDNKYMIVGALGGMFLFGLLYFLSRLGIFPVWWGQLVWTTAPLPWYTVLNHLGIVLLAGTDMILMMGLGKWEQWDKYRWVFAGMVVLGALGIISANFGLAIWK